MNFYTASAQQYAIYLLRTFHVLAIANAYVLVRHTLLFFQNETSCDHKIFSAKYFNIYQQYTWQKTE